MINPGVTPVTIPQVTVTNLPPVQQAQITNFPSLQSVNVQNPYLATGSKDGGHFSIGSTTTAPATNATGSWTVIALMKAIFARLLAPFNVVVSNFPAPQSPQPVSGTVAVSNFPATQPVSGTVAVSNFPAPVADQLVHVGNFPATQPVSVNNFPASTAVNNFPATQPVSGAVSVSNLPATQPVSGTVAVSNFPASTSVNNFPATQQVSGTVAVSNFPAVQATRELLNTGRQQVCLMWENLAGTTAETLIAFTTGSRAGVALTPATAYTVSAGKTFRIQSLAFVFGQNGSSACNYRARIRQAGSLLVTSPAIAGGGAGGPSNTCNTLSVPLPDGLEIAAGQQIGLTHTDSATGGIFSAYLVGFEY
jgi:hypothetical protein